MKSLNIFTITLLFIMSLLTIACNDDDKEPEVFPIRFTHQDYTILFGTTASIDFYDGGGVYELEASNPDVLGKVTIDLENHQLKVFPASVGESSLTITDVNAHSSVTLRFTVEDFYLSFRIDEITGENANSYLTKGGEIRFIRDEENTKQVKIMRHNNLTHQMEYVANGHFDITQSSTNIFTLDMALHSKREEELEAFSYTIGGDWECLRLFESYFGYDWGTSIASKSLPVKQLEMTLTDTFNDCKITCTIQPFNPNK
ncbi:MULTISPECIES: hypothetical protein [Muribaculaceae]|uniref:hypothetical protein n=1 Tax=Muribaculaceae TaxID=2005473 RepID=UPI0010938672|nr:MULTISPECIES: hypothetical protein [Muribaculaceae]TGY04557.1 hypothetical protein E5354_05490 [Muribaculum sp. NM65_B17]THG44122.1 hypothetical protein E5985_03435 [Muribaculaceae bacterium]